MFVEGLDGYVINEASTAALILDMTYRKMVAFSQKIISRKQMNGHGLERITIRNLISREIFVFYMVVLVVEGRMERCFIDITIGFSVFL